MAQTEQFTNVVWTDDCGCYLTAKVPASVITRCPLHEAAPALLKALEAIDKETASLKGLRSVVRVIVHSAIAQAREVPTHAQ